MKFHNIINSGKRLLPYSFTEKRSTYDNVRNTSPKVITIPKETYFPIFQNKHRDNDT